MSQQTSQQYSTEPLLKPQYHGGILSRPSVWAILLHSQIRWYTVSSIFPHILHSDDTSWFSVIIIIIFIIIRGREFRDGLDLRYDWPITDILSTCFCGESFTIDHAMIFMKGGFIIQRHNDLWDLEAKLLNMVWKGVVTEPVLQDVKGEQLTQESNKVQDARLDTHAHGFWEPQQLAFFDVRVCHLNAESYRDLKPQQIYHLHESEKNC